MSFNKQRSSLVRDGITGYNLLLQKSFHHPCHCFIPTFLCCPSLSPPFHYPPFHSIYPFTHQPLHSLSFLCYIRTSHYEMVNVLHLYDYIYIHWQWWKYQYIQKALCILHLAVIDEREMRTNILDDIHHAVNIVLGRQHSPVNTILGRQHSPCSEHCSRETIFSSEHCLRGTLLTCEYCPRGDNIHYIKGDIIH